MLIAKKKGEIAIVCWEKDTAGKYVKPMDRLCPAVVIADDTSVFSDFDF